MWVSAALALAFLSLVFSSYHVRCGCSNTVNVHAWFSKGFKVKCLLLQPGRLKQRWKPKQQQAVQGRDVGFQVQQVWLWQQHQRACSTTS
ncbi:unnamed protein product [Closterium sp. Yama58-4]|nr:unnamed protein product [Closterium sp. Yama58-4]